MADKGPESSGRADSVETSGGTVEEAVKRALLQLDTTLDEVDIEILESGGPRLLGVGRGAQVRVTRRARPFSYEAADDASGAQPAALGSAPGDANRPDEARADLGPNDGDAAPPFDDAEPPVTAEVPPPAAERGSSDRPRERNLIESGEELQDAAEELLAGLLDRMGFVADFELIGDDPLTYNIIGDDDFGKLIGRRGETLRSFGYLVNLMIGRRLGQPCRVIVDITGYRQRRAEQLAELAESLADEVRETQEPVTLESMPANERRLVHVALADDADVRTYSIGEGDERRVVISPKG